MDVFALVAEVDGALRTLGRPDRAESEGRYLRSELTHLGTSVPDTRRAVRAAVRGHRPLDHDGVIDAVEALWAAPVHERRLAAIELLIAAGPLVGPDDLPLLEELLRASRTWALLDPLAGSVVGGLVTAAADDRMTPRLDRWAEDDDFWMRRAALLAHLPAVRQDPAVDADDPNLRRFLRYADAMLDEREFFVRKAIGWVLRDLGRRRPDLVAAWLLPRTGRASGVTIREAVKPLAPADAAAVRAAYGARTSGGSEANQLSTARS